MASLQFLKRASLVAHARAAQRPMGGSMLARMLMTPASPSTMSTRSTMSRVDDVELPEKPGSLSYFTGNYKYNDLLIDLNMLHKRYQDWAGVYAPTTPPVGSLPSDFVPMEKTLADQDKMYSWKLCSKMSEMLGIPLKTAQWRQITAHLNALASLPRPLPVEISRVLSRYERLDTVQQQKQLASKSQTLDALGRAYGLGRRKESSARCWVVAGEGKILVNGLELDQYFARPSDQSEVMLPLEVTENKDKYNVWVLANGGGTTGQAQAIKLGVSRALLIHDSELKPMLRQAGCITRDPRVVERKKEGQRKARAKYTWVKR